MTISRHTTLAALVLLGTADVASACGSEPYIGEVCAFAGRYCPEGYLPADGRQLPVSAYSALYAQIGNFYGGNATNFNLPDLRGRAVVGAGAATAATSAVALAQQRGQETTTLTTSNMPPGGVNVNVTLQALQANGTDSTPQAGDLLAVSNASGRPQPLYAPSSTAGSKVALGGVSATASMSGAGGLPVAILPPELGLNVCIVVNGLWPPQP